MPVLRHAENAPEEGGGAHEHRGMVGLDDPGQHAAFGGIGVVDHSQAQQQRQDRGGGQAEGVERRQAAHDPLVFPEVEGQGRIPDVRQDVAVAQRHRLGVAFAAAGEQHRRSGGRLLRHQGGPVEPGPESRRQLGRQGDLLAGLVQQQQAVLHGCQVHTLGIEPIDERGHGDDVPHPHQIQSEAHAPGAGGPVHQYRGLARKEQRQVDDAGPARGRQHESHVGALQALEEGLQHHDRGDHIPVGLHAACLVGHHDPAGVPLGLLEEDLGNGVAFGHLDGQVGAGVEPGVGYRLEFTLAQGDRGARGGQQHVPHRLQ